MISLQAGLLTYRAGSPITPADLGITASTYASFAEIMTGFSFAALAIYLAYESAKGRHSAEEEANGMELTDEKSRNTKENGRQKHPVQVGMEHPICRSEVAATLFYCIASLAISSFLYASLTTQVDDPPKVAAAILLYGVIFGTSVLTFFYSLTLMTYGNSYTSNAARAAYWVVVIVGPAVVLRFLADAAQAAWNSRCGSACSLESWSPPLIGGMAILVLLLIFSILISKNRIFEKWPPLYSLCNWLCVRPVLPARVTFLSAAGVALAAILVTEPVKYMPSEYFIWGSLIGGLILLAFFALACGCVIGPRLTSRGNVSASGQ